jgi:uncharacterized RDD family membrane protein YckC
MTSVHDRVTQLLEGIRHGRRDIVGPEGVPLPVEVAQHAERLSAFAIDLIIGFLAALFSFLPIFILIRQGVHSAVAIALVLFISFFVRNLYFVFFELTWQGATPGKRIMGLRVVDRRGGPLTPAAVIARNLTREIECFLPLGLLIRVWLAGQSAAAWEQLVIGLWLFLFSALPFFNRDRMRGGDLIAGTMVIALPRRVLLGDLVEQPATYAFSEQQLNAYGAFELQVLEAVLRRPIDRESQRLLRDVCERICRKIAWPTPVAPQETLAFLREFYSAERAYLERAQLFGRMRADKHDTGPRA